MKLKRFSKMEFSRILEKNGFIYKGCKGDHFKYEKDGKKIVICKRLNHMIVLRLIKENNLIV